jgi:hypothetical protein
MRRFAPILLTAAFAIVLGGCAHKPATPKAQAADDEGSVVKFNFGKKKDAQAGIGVNGYLWRATLDTLNFMPVASADPFGGTFITDWHSADTATNERFKVQVFILDNRLRADGIAVQVFRQVNNGSGWLDASVSPDTTLQIENAILTRARQLRIANIETSK